MASGQFEHCLSVTLKWEGEYSNHPDDPGGPTMRGITQREYDAWRKQHAAPKRPVNQIEEAELRAIYRNNYWDAMTCGDLAAGMDLCVFDAAVNSGVHRAQQWLESADTIDMFCNQRLEFLQGLGRLWRVFGQGWRRRVLGIRAEAHRMQDGSVEPSSDERTLHAGMKGQEIMVLQEALRKRGYPAGSIDGIFGEQTYRALVLFQHDHELNDEPGVWRPEYQTVLDNAGPMLPRRQHVTHKDLEAAGDQPIRHMNFLQRIFAWIFGASAVAQAFESDNVVDSVQGIRTIAEPVQGLAEWFSGNKWLLVAAGCVALIALIRLLRREHVKAYQNFDYQGQPQAVKGAGNGVH
jgi:lysozyme family protein